MCDECNDTGFVGDLGPGVRGNNEIEPCSKCRKIVHVGCINVTLLFKRLTQLNSGLTLVLEHEVYGSCEVKMNPQGNRIYVSKNLNFKKCDEHNLVEDAVISDFLLWNYGNWSVKQEVPHTTAKDLLFDLEDDINTFCDMTDMPPPELEEKQLLENIKNKLAKLHEMVK